uniref:Single-stranded DNA binding protein Ssb-like OB fold domain-containing protein n=1 Tax=Arcella intermedia TaxID=1963864 RepID=A0A6B2LRY9_9EUKA
MQKAEFVKCNAIGAGTSGHNVRLKIVEICRLDIPNVRIAEVIAGDETASIVITLRDDQVDLFKEGDCVELRNAKVEMFTNRFMRLVVDKWGKLRKIPDIKEKVNMANNKSIVEYELVK